MLEKTQSLINNINEWVGRCVAWLIIAMVLITFSNVVMRYGFNFGLIAIQESVIYLHSFAFMLAIAYTYKHNEHVRVDIFYSKYSDVQKAWTDLLGTLFLLFPFCFYLVFSSWEYASNSWMLFEGSREAGGLPLVFILKTLVPLMPILLLVQGISCLCNSITIIRSSREL
jgi:TRAP-type mannitol/chloroaromatic compound transport system permease small subunit|tara:strand:- start:2640 stop:3149 length:510 start_codon:yes stop_codon:yes gene_type:complete